MPTPSCATRIHQTTRLLVIRGGLHSLDVEKVIEVCSDSFADYGFYGLSVFAALDGDVEGLCLRLEHFRSPGTNPG